MAVVRGDYDLGLEKLSGYLKYPAYRQAGNEELASVGLVPGFLSPIGVDQQVRIVVDDAVAKSSNLVYGANEEDYHLINGNFGRDFDSKDVADLSLTREDKICLQCGGTLREIQALEVGHIFKLGDKYSSSMHADFVDEKGEMHPFIMGCYGFGISRTAAAAVEQNHDKDGIVWPESISPMDVIILPVNVNDVNAMEVAGKLETDFEERGVDVLVDDRDLSPGVKFKDADLVGIPLRITIGKKLKDGNVELFHRATGETEDIPLADALERILEKIGP